MLRHHRNLNKKSSTWEPRPPMPRFLLPGVFTCAFSPPPSGNLFSHSPLFAWWRLQLRLARRLAMIGFCLIRCCRDLHWGPLDGHLLEMRVVAPSLFPLLDQFVSSLRSSSFLWVFVDLELPQQPADLFHLAHFEIRFSFAVLYSGGRWPLIHPGRVLGLFIETH